MISSSIRRDIGKAVGDYLMLRDGDRVLIGLSGGKDSLLLTLALAELRSRSPVKFSLSAYTVSMDENEDDAPLRGFCASLDVAFGSVFHPILDIIRKRDERSPCSFCANMRRGILSGYASGSGFNVLALGHNLDDAVETAYLNLFRAGRFKSFKPRFYQDRTKLWLIRPLVYVRERRIAGEAARLGLPVRKSSCPYAGETERQRVKELLGAMGAAVPDIHANTLNALRNLSGEDSWRALKESAEHER